jgi:hypothetical protein
MFVAAVKHVASATYITDRREGIPTRAALRLTLGVGWAL